MDDDAEALKTALDALEDVASGGTVIQYVVGLAAAVVRLRERCTVLQETADDLERLFELHRERERPWIKQWRAETGRTLALPDYGDMLVFIAARADRAIAGHDQICDGLEHGRVSGEDVVWFDTITTLWEFCAQFCDRKNPDDGADP